MIVINLSIEDINESIKNKYTEDSDISDLLLRNDEELKEFIFDAIEYYLNPPDRREQEMNIFQLGQNCR